MSFITYKEAVDKYGNHGDVDGRPHDLSPNCLIVTADEFYKHTGVKRRSSADETKYPTFPHLLDAFEIRTRQTISQVGEMEEYVKFGEEEFSYQYIERIARGKGLAVLKIGGLWYQALIINHGIKGVSSWCSDASNVLVGTYSNFHDGHPETEEHQGQFRHYNSAGRMDILMDLNKKTEWKDSLDFSQHNPYRPIYIRLCADEDDDLTKIAIGFEDVAMQKHTYVIDWEDGDNYDDPLEDFLYDASQNFRKRREELGWSMPSCPVSKVILHDGVTDLAMLDRAGRFQNREEGKSIFIDLEVYARMFNFHRPVSLDYFSHFVPGCAGYHNESMTEEMRMATEIRVMRGMADILDKERTMYWNCGVSGDYGESKDLLDPIEFGNGVFETYYAFADARNNGMQINHQKRKEHRDVLKKDLLEREMAIKSAMKVPMAFNFASSKQMNEHFVLSGRIPNEHLVRTKKGTVSFSADAMRYYLSQGFIEFEGLPELMEDKRLMKTWLADDSSMVKMCRRDGSISATFVKAGTSTGRDRCIQPNLQNIPNHTRDSKIIRSLFGISSTLDVDYRLVEIDVKSFQAMIVCILAKDEDMAETFLGKDGWDKDIHSKTAGALFYPNKVQADVLKLKADKDETFMGYRSLAKAVNFSLLFNTTAYSFVDTTLRRIISFAGKDHVDEILYAIRDEINEETDRHDEMIEKHSGSIGRSFKCSHDDAMKYLKFGHYVRHKFIDQYPGICRWADMRGYPPHGIADGVFGLRRFLPALRFLGSTEYEKKHARNICVNSIAQNFEAHCINKAVTSVCDIFSTLGAVIHDSLVMYIREDNILDVVKRVGESINETAEQYNTFGIQFEVEHEVYDCKTRYWGG